MGVGSRIEEQYLGVERGNSQNHVSVQDHQANKESGAFPS